MKKNQIAEKRKALVDLSFDEQPYTFKWNFCCMNYKKEENYQNTFFAEDDSEEITKRRQKMSVRLQKDYSNNSTEFDEKISYTLDRYGGSVRKVKKFKKKYHPDIVEEKKWKQRRKLNGIKDRYASVRGLG